MFNLFGKKKDDKPVFKGVSEYTKQIMEMLDCPCEYFPKGTNPEVVMSAYNEAFAKREMGGYTPLIIAANDMLMEVIGDYACTAEELRANRDKLLASQPIDGDKWFLERLGVEKENFGDEWKNMVGEIEHIPGDPMKEFSGFISYSDRRSEECFIAKIPTKEPWEVFAWLPFGGWNECPMPEEILWIAKYWYEKFGAIPAVMTSDVLEFAAAPVKDEKTAAGLALQQFAFCSDIVTQGVDTVGRLAGGLMESSVWYFWWD